jgi:hypothetical protein
MKKFLAAFALFALPFSAFAHGAGAFYETVVGSYKIDVGFSTPAPILGESVIFDFQLRNADSELNSGTDVEFEDAWVKIQSDENDKVVFASGIHNAEFGGPRMSYVFPKTGSYTISVRYEDANGTLAEASFPMTVVPDPSASSVTPVQAGTAGAGFLIGALLVYALLRFNILKVPSR